MNNLPFIATLENLVVHIEFANMDAHVKATNKAVIKSLIEICRFCRCKTCDRCKWHSVYLKIQKKI